MVFVNVTCRTVATEEELFRKTCLPVVDDTQEEIKVIYFLLGNYPASGFYMPTFRNTLFHLRRQVDLPAYEDGTDRVFRNVGI